MEDLEALLEKARSPDWRERKQAMDALASAPGLRALGTLIAGLQDPDNTAVAEAAATALLRRRGDVARAALLAALNPSEGDLAADPDVDHVADHVLDAFRTAEFQQDEFAREIYGRLD